jgi:Tol biopolymer transport system component
MLKLKSSFLAGLLLVAGACTGEPLGDRLPQSETDIFLLDLVATEGSLTASEFRDLAVGPGYQNQPAFLSDGLSLLYTARVKDEIDTYQYTLASGETRRLTLTAENEYSPAPVPGSSRFSVVLVEANDQRRLWSYAADGGDAELLVAQPARVGFYAWGDSETVVLTESESTSALYVVDVTSGDMELLLENVGRSLQSVPGREAVSFVHKLSATEWWVKILDLETNQIESLVQTRPYVEDHAWHPSGTLLMAHDSRLFQWRQGPGPAWDNWSEIADYSLIGLREISRLAVSPDGMRLALVAEGSGTR